MSKKGLGTTQDGISRYTNDQDMFVVRSLPRNAPTEPSQSAQLEKKLFQRLKKNRKVKFIRSCIKNIAFLTVAPVYYVAYRFPHWLYTKKVRPGAKRVQNVGKSGYFYTVKSFNFLYQHAHERALRVQKKIEQAKAFGKSCVHTAKKVPVFLTKRTKEALQSPVKAIQVVGRGAAFLANKGKEHIAKRWEKVRQSIAKVNFTFIGDAVRRKKEALTERLLQTHVVKKIYKPKVIDYYFPQEEELTGWKKQAVDVFERGKTSYRKKVKPVRHYVYLAHDWVTVARRKAFLLLLKANKYPLAAYHFCNDRLNRALDPVYVKMNSTFDRLSAYCQAGKAAVARFLGACRLALWRRVRPIFKKFEPVISLLKKISEELANIGKKAFAKISRCYFAIEKRVALFRDICWYLIYIPALYAKIYTKFTLLLIKESLSEIKFAQ